MKPKEYFQEVYNSGEEDFKRAVGLEDGEIENHNMPDKAKGKTTLSPLCNGSTDRKQNAMTEEELNDLTIFIKNHRDRAFSAFDEFVDYKCKHTAIDFLNWYLTEPQCAPTDGELFDRFKESQKSKPFWEDPRFLRKK